MYSPLDLTFGIELEFVVAYGTEQYANPAHLEVESQVRAQIIRSLQDAGVYEVNDVSDATYHQFWTVGVDGSIKAQPEDPYDPRWGGCRFAGIELRTPIMYWSESAVAFQQLGKVLQVIQQNFAAFVNPSCGFHVHVGNGECGFPTDTWKKFAQVVTAFEKQLSSIHPPHRVDNVHCRPPSCNFGSKDLIAKLNTLESAQDEEALIYCMSCNTDGANRGFAYNMTNLVADEDAPPTIEFRQHEGTLGLTAISAWATLACGLVDRCHELTHTDLVELLSRGVSLNPPTLVQLLRVLDLDMVADLYERRTLYLHPESNGIYNGEAWVTEPEPDVEMAESDSEISSSASGQQMTGTGNVVVDESIIPTDSDSDLSELDSDSDLDPDLNLVATPTSLEEQMASDEVFARRLAQGLRPRGKSVRTRT